MPPTPGPASPPCDAGSPGAGTSKSPTPGDPHRVHDQIFIDGTSLAGGCLLIAATTSHIIDWHWCRSETTTAYTHLLTGITAPLLITTDGGQGAQSAIKSLWPTTNVQRCLVHVQRVVRRHTTSRPRTTAGTTLYRLALKLTDIHDLDAAADWVARLQEFTTVYRDYLNEKTRIDPQANPTGKRWTWTHERVRKVHNSLLTVYRRGHLFNYFTLTDGLTTTGDDAGSPALKSTTNTLEGGINSVIKNLARAHRGLTAEHQRTVIDWWLYLHTQIPDDLVKIAGDRDGGRPYSPKHKACWQLKNRDHPTTVDQPSTTPRSTPPTNTLWECRKAGSAGDTPMKSTYSDH